MVSEISQFVDLKGGCFDFKSGETLQNHCESVWFWWKGLVKKGSWSVISNFIIHYGRHLSKS